MFVERLWRRPGIGRDRRRHLLPDPRLVDLPRHTAKRRHLSGPILQVLPVVSADVPADVEKGGAALLALSR